MVLEYFYSSTLLTCTYFEYSSTFKSKVLVHVLEYLELVLVPNTGSNMPIKSVVGKVTKILKNFNSLLINNRKIIYFNKGRENLRELKMIVFVCFELISWIFSKVVISQAV